ncbi:MAG: SAM-dependent methyltransferase [Desulfobulbaceae bacterium]|nr:MAG: SAM-dependent methyltransferase [Desulfobulbaceae bacterium]
MGFSLDKIVPWGRSFEEYVAMFSLTEDDLARSILGCGDGPAGFNAELARQGGSVTSIDPLYASSSSAIRRRIGATYDTVMRQMRTNRDDYIWSSIGSVAELGRIRMSAMHAFLADYDGGKREGRYIAGELPCLPCADKSFDIALSSHFLFLYSAHLSAQFHVRALVEMVRVASEVRVFPLLCLDGTPSPHVGDAVAALEERGFQSEIIAVPYEFQRGAHEMLRIIAA